MRQVCETFVFQHNNLVLAVGGGLAAAICAEICRAWKVSIFYAILCLVIPVLPTSYVNPTVASVGLNWAGIRTSTIMAVSTLALQSVYVNRFIKKEDKILPNWSQTCTFLFVCWFMNATLIGVRELLRYAKAHEDTFDPLLAVTLALLLTRFPVMIMKAVWGRLPNFPIFAVGGLLYYPEVRSRETRAVRCS